MHSATESPDGPKAEKGKSRGRGSLLRAEGRKKSTRRKKEKHRKEADVDLEPDSITGDQRQLASQEGERKDQRQQRSIPENKGGRAKIPNVECLPPTLDSSSRRGLDQSPNRLRSRAEFHQREPRGEDRLENHHLAGGVPLRRGHRGKERGTSGPHETATAGVGLGGNSPPYSRRDKAGSNSGYGFHNGYRDLSVS